jgi:VanZ family protein
VKRAIYPAALVIYMALILVLSIVRDPGPWPEFNRIDKLYHFVSYSGMGFLTAANLSAPGMLRWRRGRIVAVSCAAAFAFGAMVEVLQYFTTVRSAEALDAVANGAGGLFGAYVFVKIFVAGPGGGSKGGIR